MSKLSNYIRNRKTLKNEVILFYKYIKKGLYLFSSTYRTFQKVGFFTIFNLKKVKYLYYFSGKGEIAFFEIKKGTEKINLVAESKVISKYYIDGVPLEKIKKNIDTYLSKLRINHNSYESFSFEDNEIVAPRIKGNVIIDKRHNKIILERLLEAAIDSEIVIMDNTCFYAQHGDVYGANVIWETDEEFTTIDNEGVGLYPAFYDVFMIISINVVNAREFMDICNKNIRYFEDFGKKNNIDINNSFFDYYVSLFVLFRMNSYYNNKTTIKHRPFLFLDSEDSSRLFPGAKIVLENIYAGISNENLNEIYEKVSNQL